MEEEQTLTQDISEARQQHHAMRHSNSKYKNTLLKHSAQHHDICISGNWTEKVVHHIQPASPFLCKQIVTDGSGCARNKAFMAYVREKFQNILKVFKGTMHESFHDKNETYKL
jgi:hypothetical protein